MNDLMEKIAEEAFIDELGKIAFFKKFINKDNFSSSELTSHAKKLYKKNWKEDVPDSVHPNDLREAVNSEENRSEKVMDHGKIFKNLKKFKNTGIYKRNFEAYKEN